MHPRPNLQDYQSRCGFNTLMAIYWSITAYILQTAHVQNDLTQCVIKSQSNNQYILHCQWRLLRGRYSNSTAAKATHKKVLVTTLQKNNTVLANNVKNNWTHPTLQVGDKTRCSFVFDRGQFKRDTELLNLDTRKCSLFNIREMFGHSTLSVQYHHAAWRQLASRTNS